MAIPGRTVRRCRMRMNLSRIRRLATCAVLIVATASCGGDSSPTTPVSPTPPSPQPQIPNVAGTYRGPLTITAALEGGVVMVSPERNHATHRGAGRGTAHDHGLGLDLRRDQRPRSGHRHRGRHRPRHVPARLRRQCRAHPYWRRHLRHHHTGAHHADVLGHHGAISPNRAQ